jgi:ubiquinone/menaquinone biosynthesis C-methylase UbiE
MRRADEDGRPGFAVGGAREIARAYDAAAPNFDRHRALPDGVAEAIRASVMAAVGVPRPRLLDIGSGAGRIGWPFVAAGDDYIGVDFSFGMLREFMGRAEWNGAPARLVQADGERLPLADASLDVVLLMQVLSAARDGRRLIAEARRVLQPAGCLIFGRTVRVEARHRNDRLSHERVDSKIERLIEGASAVPTQSDIRALSHIDQPAHAKLHLLSAASEGEARILAHRRLQIGKSLLQINLIDVGPRRQASRCHLVVVELDECSKAVANM